MAPDDQLDPDVHAVRPNSPTLLRRGNYLKGKR